MEDKFTRHCSRRSFEPTLYVRTSKVEICIILLMQTKQQHIKRNPERETDRQRQKQRETDRDRERQRETEAEADRQTETERQTQREGKGKMTMNMILLYVIMRDIFCTI